MRACIKNKNMQRNFEVLIIKIFINTEYKFEIIFTHKGQRNGALILFIFQVTIWEGIFSPNSSHLNSRFCHL